MELNRRNFLRMTGKAALVIPVLGTGTTLATAVTMPAAAKIPLLTIKGIPKGATVAVFRASAVTMSEALFCDKPPRAVQQIAVPTEQAFEQLVIRCRKPGILPFEAYANMSGGDGLVHIVATEDPKYE